jgi:hypothetical protein
MIKIIIERWNYPDGRTEHLWSVWRDGKRIGMGGPHQSAEASEAEAQAACQKSLGQAADKIERL